MVDVQSIPVEEKTEPAAPPPPNYLLSPNAVFEDEGVQWRYGKPPDYSKTRKVWEEGRKMNHAAGSLEQIVENLVKNWEVEASFKPRLEDWRTINPEKYTFSMSGGPPQSAEHMLKVGTYNAIIAPNEYYDPSNSDFASSHKTFKRMMPTFAWELMEVYSGPPKVVFRWRHWGVMKNDYVGFNNKGQKVTAKAHGGPIEIYGTTVAVVDDQTRVVSLDTYMDSLDMFRQIAPHGVVNYEPMNRRVGLSDALDADAPSNDGIKIAQAHNQSNGSQADTTPENAGEKHISNSTGQPTNAFVPNQAACPFMGGNTMGGVEAPHPLLAKNEDAMSVDASSADSEFSGSVLVNQNTTAAQTNAAQQGAPMDLDIQNTDAANNDSNFTTGASDANAPLKRPIYSSPVTGDLSTIIKAPRMDDESATTGTRDAVDAHLEKDAAEVHPHPKDVEEAVRPVAGEAVVAAADAEETRRAKAEMSEVREEERALVMNRE